MSLLRSRKKYRGLNIMKKGSYISCMPYGINRNESNDIFRLIYNAVSENNINITDSKNLLTSDNYIINEKNIMIENSDYYLSYKKNTGKKGQDLNIAHCNMDSNLRFMLDVKNAKTHDTIYSFTKAVQIFSLITKIDQKKKI